MQRRSREERKLQYLDAAIAILAESVDVSEDHSGLALAHVKIDDVAERANVTKGAIYHIWPTQEAYWAELLQAMLAETTAAGSKFADWAEEVTGSDYDGPPPTHLDVCRVGFESRLANSASYVRASVQSYPSDEGISDQLDHEAQEVASIYPSATESVISSAGRTIRPDISYSQIIALLDALLNGLVILHQYHPEQIRNLVLEDGSTVDPYSIVSESAMLRFSTADADVDAGSIPFKSILGIPLDGPSLESIRNHAESVASTATTSDAADREAFYIRTGLDLLKEINPSIAAVGAIDALGNVRIADVAQRVGVSKGSIYHIWPSQELFRLDVLKHVLTTWSDFSAMAIAALMDRSKAEGWTPEELLRNASDLAFDACKADPTFLARFSFALHVANPEVASAFRDGNFKVNQQFSALLDKVLTDQGRQLRAPIDLSILSSYVEAALYGLVLLNGTSPDLVDGHRMHLDEGTPKPPSYLAEMIAGLCEYLSEPIDS